MPLAKICALYANLGLSVTPGALAQAMDRLAAKGAATYQALKAELAAQAVISPDETGWRVGGHNAWLWAFTAVTITIYAICDGRGFDDAITVLPANFAGTLCRDGWAPYRKFTKAAHQSCLAHLLRRCHELGRSNPPSGMNRPGTGRGSNPWRMELCQTRSMRRNVVIRPSCENAVFGWCGRRSRRTAGSGSG
jgi:hypothetical protein